MDEQGKVSAAKKALVEPESEKRVSFVVRGRSGADARVQERAMEAVDKL